MSVHIGLLIWKEMKRKSISREKLADELKISKGRIGKMLNTPNIDTDLLVKVSIILETDFFSHFHIDEELKQLKALENASEAKLNAQLRALLKEKNRLLELADETIKSQKRIIRNLEQQRSK